MPITRCPNNRENVGKSMKEKSGDSLGEGK